MDDDRNRRTYYKPVLFRFDSSQRKKPVIIFDSEQHVGKSSEWFFVCKNSKTLNETYRCAQCRSLHVKTRKEGKVPLNQGARITVRENYFITNPDFPLGVHICDFENNENCNTYMVWSRRALLRANSELRLNPEKPKLKFTQLLEAIQNGNNEYGHLSQETRQLVVQQLTSNNGFNSRRRSFARNNLVALNRLRKDYCNNTGKNQMVSPKYEKSLQLICGLCPIKFNSDEKRKEHWNLDHQMTFIETNEHYEGYDLINDNGYPNEIIVIEEEMEMINNVDENEVIISTSNSLPMAEEVIYNADFLCKSNMKQRYEYSYMDNIREMLNKVEEYANSISDNPTLRRKLFTQVEELIKSCSSQ